MTLRELDEDIRKTSEMLEEIRNPSLRKGIFRKRNRETNLPLPSTPPDFTLAIDFDYDTRSYSEDYQRQTWSYQRLNHEISSVSGRPSQ